MKETNDDRKSPMQKESQVKKKQHTKLNARPLAGGGRREKFN